MSEETNEIPEEIEQGLAFAYGEETTGPSPHSVIERIGEITGIKPKVLLRDESTEEAPILKALAPEDRIEAGKYVVHGELGRGGVGSVHRGHDQDLGRDVAMKFLHDKYKDDSALLHRFVEEAQIGGQLQHPGIVPVYDLGLVDGKAFFSMKLVKGQTLAKKLAERASPADDQRSFLSIFEDICQTLAYAHARGVVHRDLKPANIMIGSFGEVQVVDWGMGKVLASGGVADEELAANKNIQQSVIETVRSGGHGTQSLVGSVMGTPAYMPPEQARGDVEAMEERSDVFALGAILCEILTGKPPYLAGELDELLIMAATANQVDAHKRLAECNAERRLVELAKQCLAPAPAARPRSAEVVSLAIHKHLTEVEERVHTARVEAAEAKVRAAALKRTQTMGMGLLGVTVIGLAVSRWFWRAADKAAHSESVARSAAIESANEARASSRLAEEKSEIANRELARALEIKNLIKGMLQGIDPSQAKGADITILKRILDSTSKRLEGDAMQDQLIAGELHFLIGSLYRKLSLQDDAEKHLTKANGIAFSTLDKKDRRVSLSLVTLGELYQEQGRYSEAEPLLIRALELNNEVSGPEHEFTAAARIALGMLRFRQGRYAEAETLCRTSLDTFEIKTNSSIDTAIQTRTILSNACAFQGNYEEAERLLLQAIKLIKKHGGPDSVSIISTMGELALVYDNLGKSEQAESLYMEAIDLAKRVLGERHSNTLMLTNNLGTLYHGRGQNQRAVKMFREANTLQKEAFGPEHPDTLMSMHNLVNQYIVVRQYDKAKPLLAECLDARKRVLGPEHPETLTTIGLQARLHRLEGEIKLASEIYRELNEVSSRLLGPHHDTTVSTRTGLAEAYLHLYRFDEAKELCEQVLDARTATLGEENIITLESMEALARVLMHMGNGSEAVEHLEKSLTHKARLLGDENPATLGGTTNLAMVYLSMKRHGDAAELLAEHLPVMERVLGMEHQWTWLAVEGLKDAYLALGEAEDALPLQRKLLERSTQEADAPNATPLVLNQAAWTLLTIEPESLQDPTQALKYATRACEHTASGKNLGVFLDTLALAQFRTGDTSAAVASQRRAVELMPKGADPTMADRLAEYEAAVQGE
ncbi:MAG: tetratricopeptide repeat protein [Planctomycetota bacterium]|nr:tetratricopeptide repeat protein [Planctomycetota bacterium]